MRRARRPRAREPWGARPNGPAMRYVRLFFLLFLVVALVGRFGATRGNGSSDRRAGVEWLDEVAFDPAAPSHGVVPSRALAAAHVALPSGGYLVAWTGAAEDADGDEVVAAWTAQRAPVGKSGWSSPALVAAADSGEVSGAFTPSLTFVAAGGSKDTGLGASAGRRVSTPVLRLRFEAGGEVFVCDSTDEGQTWSSPARDPDWEAAAADARATRLRRGVVARPLSGARTQVSTDDGASFGAAVAIPLPGSSSGGWHPDARPSLWRKPEASAKALGHHPLAAAVRSSASDGHLAFIADSVDEGASWVTRETSTGLKSAGGDPEATCAGRSALFLTHTPERGGDAAVAMSRDGGLTWPLTWTNTRCKHPMTSGDGAFEGFAMTCVGGEGQVRFYMATTAGFRARAEERRGGEGVGGG